MSLKKYLKRTEYIHWQIAHETTGSCDEFASKLGLSRRQLLDNIKDLKELGAPIKFSKSLNTYYYSTDWQPFKVPS